MIALLSLLLILSPGPDPFTTEDFLEEIGSRDISVVNQSDAEKRHGANTCTAIVTARSARLVTCEYATVADARRVAYNRSDYARTVFQRGTVVIYLRKGASSRLREAVVDVTGIS
ncbi:hypothetical protein CRI94_03645 [Longibacter salinarum]|uniref:Uncharacterized protein n=1 Tax=Longibacter salinarum TaxID=1850348 RepID=A0A2A8CZS0_9BACT|nr:hypothetical protein [Longibacter salinarum]PEN14146.1 hypothetical protein CRI94_03645 [Longibacter salinarum]